MIVKDQKKQKQAEFIRTHTLSEQDFRQMILEKMERAKAYSKAVRKREVAHEQS